MAEEQQVPVLSLMLTHDEWLTVWAFYFVAFHWNAYGVEDMTEADADDIWDSMGRSMRWAIAKLACDYGMKFTGIGVDEDGHWYPKQEGVVEPRNALFIHRLKNGMWPYPPNAIETAIRTIEGQGLSVPLEPMKTALEQVNADITEARRRLHESPEGREELAAVGEVINYLMTKAGYTRRKGAVN